MRLHLKTTESLFLMDFNYQKKLTGVIHKWLGVNNKEHGNTSLYSFSWLYNVVVENNCLICPRGANWFVSFHEMSRAKDVLEAIRQSPAMFNDLIVKEVVIQEDPDFENKELFLTASPILIKRPIDSGATEYLYDNPDCGKLMEETLRTKMKIAGLPEDDTLHIEFDLSYAKKKKKLVWYGDISNKANMCPVIIQGTNLTKQFAWNVGLGNCTGIGFGSIY